MIQKIFIKTFMVLAISFAFYACNNQEPKEDQEQTEQVVADTTVKPTEELTAVYQCPMKCEGDKTYSEPGKCPKCEMDLKKVE
jgi:hypothetical protein